MCIVQLILQKVEVSERQKLEKLSQGATADLVVVHVNVAKVLFALEDLDQVVGWHFNFAKGLLYYIDQETADFNFYKQFLTGDRVDNIKGVHGIGEKRATALLEGKTVEEMWGIIVDKLGYDRAIENGHLLYMLRSVGDSFKPPVADESTISKG